MIIINTNNRKFNFLYSLPDVILIDGIKLLFKHYNRMDEYKRLQRTYIIERMSGQEGGITYGSICYKSHEHGDNYNKTPYIQIDDSSNDYDNLGTLYFTYFDLRPPMKINNTSLFDTYYMLCLNLNRKFIINNILQ
jgi:hypothetical protein